MPTEQSSVTDTNKWMVTRFMEEYNCTEEEAIGHLAVSLLDCQFLALIHWRPSIYWLGL